MWLKNEVEKIKNWSLKKSLEFKSRDFLMLENRKLECPERSFEIHSFPTSYCTFRQLIFPTKGFPTSAKPKFVLICPSLFRILTGKFPTSKFPTSKFQTTCKPAKAFENRCWLELLASSSMYFEPI